MEEQTNENKQSLRAQLRAMLRCVDGEALKEKSAAACAQVTGTVEFERAGCVMIFLPLDYEIDATAVAVRAWQMGKTVAVPQVSYEQRHMIAVEIRSLGEAMEEDRHGVRTPVCGQPIPAGMIDLVVVPGLGFDVTGRRLGRGGGFYDRFLSQREFQRRGVTCGLAMEQQVVEWIPVQGHDIRLTMLATENRLLRFA